MEPRLSIVTIPVADLAISEHFYSSVLGWSPDEPKDEGIVFYSLGGTRLAIYPKEAFSQEIEGRAVGDATMTFTLAHNTRSTAEVDAIFAHLRDHGVTILKDPEEVFWGGYSGYFADPDGHTWEVAFNPFSIPDA